MQLNRRQRMAIVLERVGASCVWCGRPLEVGLVAATTEHLVPRIKGGDDPPSIAIAGAAVKQPLEVKWVPLAKSGPLGLTARHDERT